MITNPLIRKIARSALVLGLGALFAPAASAQLSFTARKEFPTTHNPVALVTADFDGDGIKDVAVLSRAGAEDTRGVFTIMVGDGSGNFIMGEPNHAGRNAAELITADFNGDGRPDIAVTNEGTPPLYNDSSVMIFLNTGAGRFSAPATIPIGKAPVGLVAADFDGDGKLDLAVTNSSSNSISILKGDGSGSFTLLRTLTFGTQLNVPLGIAAADFGRGMNDLVVANFGTSNPGTVLVLANDGTGNFTVGSTLTLTNLNNPRNIAIADFNNDGLYDIAISNFYSNNITRFLGRADGTFATPANTGVQGNPAQIVAVDYNNDGKMDLLVVNRGSNTVTVLDGNGSGGFAADANDPTRTLATGLQPRGLAVDDINGDGLVDVVVTNFGFDTISVILGDATRRFNTAPIFATGGRPYSVALMDINADGNLDILTANDGNLTRLFGDGTGKFSNNPPGYVVDPEHPNYTRDLNVFNGNNGFHFMVTGDFNRSGRTSLATPTPNNNAVTRILRAQDQTPTAGFTGNNIGGVGGTPVSITVGDLDGDGQPDLATANFGNNSISYLINDGGATGFRPPKAVNNVLINPTSIVAADLNGDGLSDLIVVGLSSSMRVPALAVYLTQDYNPADGTVTFMLPPITYYLPFDSAPFGLATADFDGDGRPDIAVVNQRLNSVSIFLNTAGDGTLAGPTDFPTGGVGPETLLARDLNGDGLVDLAVVNTFTNSVSILLGNGDGTFGDASFNTFGTGFSITGIAADDVNGDGKTDLVVSGYGQNLAYVLLNNSP